VASKFRSRTTPLPEDVAQKLIHMVDSGLRDSSRLARTYTEAIPGISIVDDCRWETLIAYRLVAERGQHALPQAEEYAHNGDRSAVLVLRAVERRLAQLGY
jgi:hypothetical protein